MGRRDDHRGEGPWLMLFLVLLAVGAKPAAEAATPHHRRTPPPAPTPAAASSTGRADIPPAYLVLYQRGAHACPGLSWAVLAGIGKVETNHGRSRAPGVVSGVNRFGCCSGPMQFNIRNGPPSTW
ncbi:MAG TPA: hypothetical protein VG276_28270, partial [Actinomycetes bacterium]|nr:hypothetical protein [Actinomycetes bacterium]